MLSPGQRGVGDRGYQKHVLFDLLQVEGKSFVIRIKAGTNETPIKEHEVNPDCIVFYDAEVLLGIVENNNQTEKSVCLVGYRIVRQLRIQIQNKLRDSGGFADASFFKEQKRCWL